MINAQRTTLSKLVVPLLVTNAIALALCAGLYFGLAAPIKSNTLESEGRRLDIYKSLISGDVDEAIGDLRLLATGDALVDYLQTGSQASLDAAVRRAVFISKDNPTYDKVRYIDENGREVFRVNHDGAIVPTGELQDKSERPFFQKANALDPGQIYISRIDLNVENGAVEQPVKPTLRLAVPLLDNAGRHRGIYIINIRVADLLNQLRHTVPRRANRLRVLNSEGYWLAGGSPDVEWGFALPGRAEDTLVKTDPLVWAKVQGQPAGQSAFHGGYFTWLRINPTEFAIGKPVKLVSDDNNYILMASVISPEEWADSLAQLRETFVVVGIMLVALTTLATWVFQARRRARQERDRFFNLTRDMLCIAGFDGNFRRLNPAWEKTLGFTEAEMVDHPFLTFVHPDDREKTIEETKRLVTGGEVIAFENRYRCKDGTYRWLLWSARPLVEDELIYASARDLTERKQIEEKLQLSEERARLMVESMEDYAIFMLAPDGKVMSWNLGAERIYGYRADEVTGKHFSQFYPAAKVAEKFPELELKTAVENGRVEDEGPRVRRDGSQFWANVIVTPMRNSQGELVGFVKITRDVTARRDAAERIDKLNGELKSRAELLEAANKELESFSYSVSHDLRAPLRHVHGFVEILQKSPLFQGQDAPQRHMAVIAKAAREMGLLIDDLLAFSRTGRAEMHFVSVDMNDLVSQCIRTLEVETAGRKVTWNVAPLTGVEGDPGLLRLVWANLLGNAVKYSRPREEAKIEVGEEIRRDAAGEPKEVIYFVRDNGVGFDMRYASKLFGVFQRLHRAEDFEGTGIGLANVQRIIHRHGGKVWADSKLDSGSIFHFSLPLKMSAPADTYANGKN